MNNQQFSRVMSRRSFGKGAFIAGAGAATVAMVGGTLGDARGALLSPPSADASALTDADILNFALNLEYLEAEFYTVITTGKRLKDVGIATNGTGSEGPTTGGRKFDFAPWMLEILEEVAYDEQQHVLFLRAALGGAAVAKPTINLAGVSAPGFGFDSVAGVLALARAFEDVGVSAYGGAARFISDPNVLESAARIALTEAEHAGNIRLVVAQQNVQTFALDANDYPPPPSGSKFFNVSKAALAKIRTTSMVLAILYNKRTAGSSRGGFFPNGVNGTIHAV